MKKSCMYLKDNIIKNVLIAMSLIFVFFLIGCAKSETVTSNVLLENAPHQQTNTIHSKNFDDEQLLSDFKSKVKVIENKKDFNDDSGELLYYIQQDYLESNTNDENINKIVSHYPKIEIAEKEDEEVSRIYPEDIYYDTTTYEISSIHNGILNIHTLNDSWWGSPHPYPNFRCKNYVLATGEVYDFPIEIKDDIYNKAAEKLMEIAKNNDYEGLMGDYYDDGNNRIVYLKYDEENEKNILIDEIAFKDIINKLLKDSCYEITDDKITFYIEAAYSLSDWASKALYSSIEISNEWNI